MKRCLLIFLASCCSWIGVFGQQKLSVIEKVVLNDTKSPIIWIDTMKTDINHLLMDTQRIDSLHLLKDSAAARQYGEDAAKGILVMFPKDSVKLMRLNQFLEFQGVPSADRKLRVCVNHTLVRYPSYLVIDPTYIKTVQITRNRHWGYLDEANSGEMFLNLITANYSNPVM
ncbi:MAG: hypothetical protein ABW007_27170 [Chitinophagaceae bacterium]